MKNYSNKGMFLESLIEKTSSYLAANSIGVIYKRNISMKIVKRQDNYVKAKLDSKSLSDYYGCYEGYMFDFEAKQTEDICFNMSNIKSHQIAHLQNIQNFKAKSFVLIHFIKFETFFAIDIMSLLQENKKSISHDWFINQAFKLEIVFPGILNIFDYLKTIYNK